jgi:nucleoside-diphosphate-sugar epimerase
MTRTAFIIGGTGQIGIATAARLLDEGWRVTLGHTGRREPQNVPAGATLAIARRQDTAALSATIGTVDLLVDTMAFGAAEADQLASLAGNYGRLAIISTASVYADQQGRSLDTSGETGFPQFDGPQPETAPTIAVGPESYSRAKVQLEQRLLDTITRPLAILRPCAIHGINSKHPREFWFAKRMLDGRKTIPLAGNADAHFHTSATVNIAAAITATLSHDGPIILNAGDPSPPSVREIGEAVAAHLGWTGSFVPAPADSAIGGTPFSVPSDFIVSMDAAEAIGYRPAATYAEALVPYLAWMQAHADTWRDAFPMFKQYPSDPFDYAAEDAAFAS